jgi:hypothetical protein
MNNKRKMKKKEKGLEFKRQYCKKKKGGGIKDQIP